MNRKLGLAALLLSLTLISCSTTPEKSDVATATAQAEAATKNLLKIQADTANVNNELKTVSKTLQDAVQNTSGVGKQMNEFKGDVENFKQQTQTLEKHIKNLQGIGEQATNIKGNVERLEQQTQMFDMSKNQLEAQIRQTQSKDTLLYFVIGCTVVGGLGFSLVFYVSNRPSNPMICTALGIIGVILIASVLIIVCVVLFNFVGTAAASAAVVAG